MGAETVLHPAVGPVQVQLGSSAMEKALVGGGKRGFWSRSGGPRSSAKEVETLEAESHQDQDQADEDLLDPQAVVQLVLQPGVDGHHSHELDGEH